MTDHTRYRQAAILALQPLRRPAVIPLSAPQRQLWNLNVAAESKLDMNMRLVMGVPGQVDPRALQASLNDLVKRHEILRTIYPDKEDVPGQKILDAAAGRPALTIVDCAEGSQDRDIQELQQRPFDLRVEIPLRAFLLRTATADTVLLVVNHIAIDAWSVRPMVEDLFREYVVALQGGSSIASKLPVQYADFILWHQQKLGSESNPDSLIASQMAFWTRRVRNFPPPPALMRPGTRASATQSERVPLPFSQDLQDSLARLARDSNSSLFSLLHAGIIALLAQMGSTEVIVGTPVSGRSDGALQHLVGLFENILLLCTDATGDPAFRDLLTRVRECYVSASAHQDLPFCQLAEKVRQRRTAGPLFHIMLVVEDTRETHPEVARFRTTLRPGSSYAEPVDLTFHFVDRKPKDGEPGGLEGEIEHAGWWNAASVESIRDRLFLLLEKAAADPSRTISQLQRELDGVPDRLSQPVVNQS